jgi:hypothetical protein
MIFVTANNHHSVFRPKLFPRIASRQLPAASRFTSKNSLNIWYYVAETLFLRYIIIFHSNHLSYELCKQK